MSRAGTLTPGIFTQMEAEDRLEILISDSEKEEDNYSETHSKSNFIDTVICWY